MLSRNKRAIIFGSALALGFAIFDFVSGEEFNIIKILGSAIVGGALYGLMLKWQGR